MSPKHATAGDLGGLRAAAAQPTRAADGTNDTEELPISGMVGILSSPSNVGCEGNQRHLVVPWNPNIQIGQIH